MRRSLWGASPLLLVEFSDPNSPVMGEGGDRRRHERESRGGIGKGPVSGLFREMRLRSVDSYWIKKVFLATRGCCADSCSFAERRWLAAPFC